jgi:hypothetical protein
MTLFRNVWFRLRELSIWWRELKRQGDYSDQLARFRKAEMLRHRK